MDKAKFFAAIRRDLFGGALTPQQVYRIEVLLDAIDGVGWKVAHAAYALATAHLETFNWQHLKELGSPDYFRRMYDKTGTRPAKAAELGNTEPGDGARFAGRGYVQLTGRSNYTKAGKAIGFDLVADPDTACEPAIAARILIWGMQTGAYTGKANRDYLDRTPPDYLGARRIINGTDKAVLIAGYAKTFEGALKAAGWGSLLSTVSQVPAARGTQAALPVTDEMQAVAQPPAPSQEPGFWSSVFVIILSAFKGKR